MPKITSYIPWILLLLWANTFNKFAGYLLITYQQTGLVVRNTVQRDLGITVSSILLVVLGFSYKGMLFANITLTFITGWTLFRVISRELPYSFALDVERARLFFKTALPLLPVFLFSWVIQLSDYYLLTYFRGAEAVGKYAVVYSIASVVISLSYALNYFWFPVSARLWIDDREKYRRFFKALFTVFVACLLLMVMFFELNSHWIMALLVKKMEYQDAYVIMGAIAFSYSMQVLITLLTAPLYSNLNTKAICYCYMIGGIINTLLNLLLIPGNGIIGAAVSTAVSYLVVTLLLGYCNYKIAFFRFFDSRLLLIIPLFIAGWAGSFFVRGHLSLFGILASNLLVAAVAMLGAHLLLSPEETAIIRSLARDAKIRFKGVQ